MTAMAPTILDATHSLQRRAGGANYRLAGIAAGHLEFQERMAKLGNDNAHAP